MNREKEYVPHSRYRNEPSDYRKGIAQIRLIQHDEKYEYGITIVKPMSWQKCCLGRSSHPEDTIS
jgi:hypothetical protein